MSSLNVQRVAQFQAYGEPVKIITDHPVPDPATLSPNECLVKMEYAGVCHSDVHARDGDMSLKPTLPRIGGHEGVQREQIERRRAIQENEVEFGADFVDGVA